MLASTARNHRGFTLVGLLVVLSITSILMLIAAPAFQGIIESNRLRTQTNKLVSSLHLARSEAVKRNIHVTLCPGGAGDGCSGSLQDGWQIATDPNDATTTIREFSGMDYGYAITNAADGSTAQGSVVYAPSGSVAVARDWMICPPDKDENFARAVSVNIAGRPAIVSAGSGQCD